tara:strand:+ start:8586 stop:8918 length:333 start_codon:yes stop_codon:yes gene_type:complete
MVEDPEVRRFVLIVLIILFLVGVLIYRWFSMLGPINKEARERNRRALYLISLYNRDVDAPDNVREEFNRMCYKGVIELIPIQDGKTGELMRPKARLSPQARHEEHNNPET